MMHNIFKKYYFVYVIIFFCQLTFAKSAVTYWFSGGRFGDDLFSYCHAKWIAYKYQIPFYYRPFKYSDQLVMHKLDTPLPKNYEKLFDQVLNTAKVSSYTIEPEKNILYEIPYFGDYNGEYDPNYFYSFLVDWDDAEFLRQIKKAISPLYPIKYIDIPENHFSIALHIRIGTGYDVRDLKSYMALPFYQPQCLLKFPPLTYYLEQLAYIINLYPNEKFYVHIFTDHSDPLALIDLFKQVFHNENISFGSRDHNNRHDLNVIEDFFSMIKFECLVHPDSNYSVMAAKLADYKIKIAPIHGMKNGDHFIIDKVDVRFK